jgi:hypothetical protein
MKVKTEDVLKALDSLQEGFDDEVVKASEDDLDQPEGADLGNPAKDKMSDAAKAKKMKKGELKIEHESEDEDEEKPMMKMKKMKKAEEEEEEGEEEEEEDMEMSYKKAKKSFGELPDEVQTKIEVSEFLKSLVDHNVDGLKKLSEFVAKSDSAHEARFSDLNDVVEGLAKSQAKIGVVLKAICEKLNIIENSPATAPKTEVFAKSNATERAFNSGLEEKNEEPVFKSLSNDPILAKSQISNALCDLVMKGEASDMDVINFESAGYISPELVNKLKGKL